MYSPYVRMNNHKMDKGCNKTKTPAICLNKVHYSTHTHSSATSGTYTPLLRYVRTQNYTALQTKLTN